jgi:hypothetical protein
MLLLVDPLTALSNAHPVRRYLNETPKRRKSSAPRINKIAAG